MFKIESYITPIILNHVAKYVKNIRPQDAQVSLWEGEASFQNLDLRLDVLEEELNLPFELLSGHIHELSIHVPWTKITSEPIKITINTIEFVLKLKNNSAEAPASSANSSPQRSRNESQEKKRMRQDEPQQSAGSGLVNKIINNIVVNCHNIILKYVEEDIVVSMNVQLLSFGSADERWKPAMVDVNPLKVVMRKLVQISDLTICLDKRNAAGQIDVCQEPVLYRCSLECRILRKYNANTLATSSTTRIGVFTKAMEMNISSLQFPMAMRLIKLLLALKSGKLNTSSSQETHEDEQEEQDNSADVGGSYLSWAWNLLPSFNFEPLEEEEVPTTEETGHTMDIGVYIEELNFTLKNSEFVSDSIMGSTKRLRYTPIMHIGLGGIYFEMVSSEERNWSSIKTGLTSICLEPLGVYRSDDSSANTIIETTPHVVGRSFIDKSLFDEQCLMADKGWGVTNYEEYSTRITDEYLLYRSPILAFDLVEYRQAKHDDVDPAQSDSRSESCVQYRFLSSGIIFRYNQAFLQVKNIISDYIDSYDYPAYYAEGKLETTASLTKLHPPLMEDYDALMQYIPLRTYRFELKQISFELYVTVDSSENGQKPQRRLPQSLKQTLPYFSLYLDNTNGQLTTPLQPDKLIHTVCQLPDKPKQLLDACYDNYQVNIKNLSISLMNKLSNPYVKFLSIPKLQINYSSLIQSHHWQEDEVPVRKLELNCDQFIVEFSKQELIVVQRMLKCIGNYNPYLLLKILKQAGGLSQGPSTIKLQNQFGKFRVLYRKYRNYSIWNAILKSLLCELVYQRQFEIKRYEILSTTSKVHNSHKKWLEFQAQFPTESYNIDSGIRIVLALWVEKFNCFIDAHLLEFLKYQEESDVILERESSIETENAAASLQSQPTSMSATCMPTHSLPPLLRRSSRNSLPSDRITRKISHPEETVHFSSERDEKVGLETSSAVELNTCDQFYMRWLQQLKNVLVNIEIAQGKFFIAPDFQKNEQMRIISEHMQVILPVILIKSANSDQVMRSNMRQKIALPTISQKDTFNWTFSIDGLTIQNFTEDQIENIFNPIQTNVTIALTHKKEKLKDLVYGLKVEPVDTHEKKSPFKKGNTHKDVGHKDTRSFPDNIGSIYADGRSEESLNSDHNSEHSVELPTQNKTLNKEKHASPSSKPKKEIQVKDVITFTLHADTTPIHLYISTKKVKSIKKQLNLLMNVCASMKPMATARAHGVSIEPVKIITSNEDNPNIKEFLELETNSESSKGSDSASISKLTVSLFCQWTITKIVLELESNEQQNKNKCLLELEDLLSTVDKRDDFTKYTSKVGQFHLRYMEESSTGEWNVNDSLRIKMLTESLNSPFLNVIITSVGLKNFFKRIGAKRKGGDTNRSISEVIINMQAIEIILDLDRVSEFIGPLCFLFESDTLDSETQTSTLKTNQNITLTAADLPMIHLDSKGFTLYMPVDIGKECCTVAIWKIENIQITPHLENPLQRNPIRSDVFSKASQLGILSTPGSIIEDRQYELTLKNISAATGNWEQILTHMNEQTNNFHRTNPAFEWNNQNRKTSLQLSDLFNNFTFVTIFAPCIVYNNILICGQALEFNCASDFIASLTTYQMNLISCIIIRLQNISSIINRICGATGQNKTAGYSVSQPSLRQSSSSSLSLRHSSAVQRQNSWEQKRNSNYIDLQTSSSTISLGNFFDSIDESREHKIKADSGFQSCFSRSRCNMRLGSTERFASLASNSSVMHERYDYPQAPIRKVPYTVSLIAGIFIIKIFDIKRAHEGMTELVNLPLLSFTISQPSFMITQNMFDTITHISLFNLNMNMAKDGTVIQLQTTEQLGETKKGGINLFPLSVLETKHGELSSTGIPPPLFNYKSNLSKKQILELDVEFVKPIVFILTEEYIQKLCKNFFLIYEALLENPCFDVRSKKTVVRGSKIKLMRENCFNADRLHFKLDKIEINFSNHSEYSCRLICSDLKSNIKFVTRPEKAIAKASIGALYLQMEHKVFVHPIGLRLSADFITEPWYSLPLITANVKFNVVQIDVGVYALLQLKRAFKGYKRVSSYVQQKHIQFLNNRPSQCPDNIVQSDRLLPVKCPTLVNTEHYKKKDNKKKRQREEFYQDDLRAGAFQFVEMVTDSFLPLPYQIQIIKKNYGIICWRYPQPRKMCKVHIFPVPMAVPNPIQIKCRMEYFSETQEGFMHYCDFWLSETVSKQIELPQREICANIWRVVILQSLVSVNGECFDTSEEDEDLLSITSIKLDEALKIEGKQSDFILHPKVLVGCMRIDTTFQSECVPKVQLLVSFNTLKVKLLNQPDAHYELPSMLKKFKLTKTTKLSQAFMLLTIERMNVFFSLHSLQNYALNCDMAFNVKCIDYGFLNMLYLLEHSILHSYFHVNQKQNSILANVILDKVRINVGPAILNTLISSKMHWEELLEDDKQKRHALIPKCIIINRTHSPISFGQTGTTERIPLNPRECHLYSFRSDYFNQELTFFVADEETKITEASQTVPILFKFEEKRLLHYLRLGNKCLVIKTKKLSATQVYILIKGQIELVSMVPHEFRLEIRREGTHYDEKNLLEYTILQKSRDSFFRSLQRTSNMIMRLKFLSNKGKGRSGDIPLKTNKNLPWLVKVPHPQNEFVSFWVRILREDITDLFTEKFQPQKLLITIWPIFEIQSSLTCPVSAEESSIKEQFEVGAQGGRHLLDVPATHLTEHTITFDYNFPITQKSKREYILSLKSIDWSKFFWYDEQIWNIEYALEEVGKANTSKWPYNDSEELRLQRISYTQAKSSISYNCTPTRNFSCSLCLEVSPWGLFINASGSAVSLSLQGSTERLTIESNGVEMMSALTGAFIVEVQNGANWIRSLPIYLAEFSNATSDKFYVVQENGATEIVLLCSSMVYRFVLESKNENGRTILILRSKYSITNFSKTTLCVLPFAMDNKESSTREEIKTLDLRVRKATLFPVKSLENCIGICLDRFFDLNIRKSMHSTETAFVYFVCIKVCDESDVSIPIPLAQPFTRKCFSIQNGSESIPLVVALIEKNGIFHLNIFEDTSPAILVNNQTDLKLVVAQTSASENSKVSNTTPEYDGKHFDWYQRVPAFSNCYYTPPDMYSNFPDVESTMCNLTLALYNEKLTKKNIKWSKPIRTDKTWEKFLHVPNHGDVKVIICDKHKIIRVSIYYITQQMEFSVKDLRSRLLTPPPVFISQDSDTASTDPIQPVQSPMLDEFQSQNSDKCMHFRVDSNPKQQLKIRFMVKELSFNLNTDNKDVDYMKTEICAIYVDDFVIAYDDDIDRQLNIVLGNLQIDNQLFSSGKYDFPVVLCAQELYKQSSSLPQVHYLDRVYDDLRTKNNNPMALFTLKYFEDELKISSMECTISPIRAYIEDAYLNDLFDALLECDPSNCAYQPNKEVERLSLGPGQMLLPRDVAAQAICIAEPLKLQSFRIEPLNVLLSVHTSVRLYIALDHSPLSFSSYERQQILSVPLRFGQSLGMHYLSGALFGAGWVVGSLEILGSPSGLARSFTTGLRDFVSMPVRGLFRGPWGFIVGFSQGSASLLRNVTAGTVNSVTKLAASVARNLDRLTLDQDHIERTEALRRSRPQGFTEGFSQGVTGLGISILGAVGGIARHTLEARSPVQVVTGVGKGLVGAFTKPLSGAAELVALAGQGMLYTVGFNAMPQQRSPAVSRNVAVEPSGYRIWKLLPGVLNLDQILFYEEITLVVQDKMRRAYLFLTSAVFAAMEEPWDKLTFVFPTDKVDISIDRADKTLVYVHMIKEVEDIEEDISYTNQRIMSFLRTSYSNHANTLITTDSLNDLLQSTSQTGNTASNLEVKDWAFYINEHMAEFLMQYIKVLHRKQ